AQERLWFLDQVAPGSPVYNVPLALPLRGPHDHDALERAVAELVRRHESLRTTFPSRDGRPLQHVAAAAPVRVPVAHLTERPEARRTAGVGRLRAAEARGSFNLGIGPLVRWRLLRLAPQEGLLLVTLHHIICDGWSLGVLRRELMSLYRAFRRGEPSSLPELT